MRRPADRRRAPLLAALTALTALGLAAAPGARAAHWSIAPPGPCAKAPARDLCKEGACEGSSAPVRGRFDPAAVASGPPAQPSPLPSAALFAGPGSCAAAGTQCGQPTPTNQRPAPGVGEQLPVPVLPPGVPQP